MSGLFEAFNMAIKWYIAIAFLIAGVTAFMAAEALDTIKPVMIGIVSFGIASWMSRAWFNVDKIIIFYGIAVFLFTAFIAYAFVLSMDFYIAWLVCAFVIGVPIMTLVFKKYD